MLPSLFVAISFLFTLHPIHVSVTEIEFDEKDKALEIMMRVFMDDLELTMRNRHNLPTLDILSPKEKSLDDMMREYIHEKFQVALDGKRQKVTYLGHERDGEAFVFYVEVSNVKKWKEIEVTNKVIIETHEDQSNLVHVTVRGKVRSLRLVKGNSTGKLTFDIK